MRALVAGDHWVMEPVVRNREARGANHSSWTGTVTTMITARPITRRVRNVTLELWDHNVQPSRRLLDDRYLVSRTSRPLAVTDWHEAPRVGALLLLERSDRGGEVARARHPLPSS